MEASGICPEQRDAKPREPRWSQAIPTRLWHVVGIDTSPGTRDYVTTVDYYSRFLSLISCPFQNRGVVETEVRDNGPCYNLSEFHCFAESCGFTYPKTSPTTLQSNGLTEKFVQIAKNVLDKDKS